MSSASHLPLAAFMGPFGFFEAVSSFAGHVLPGLLCCSLSASVTLPASPCDTHAQQHTLTPACSTTHYIPQGAFSISTFIWMDTSCPSQALNPLTMSIPPPLSILFPADRTDSGLEQMILVFPTLDHFLPAGGDLTGSPWKPA